MSKLERFNCPSSSDTQALGHRVGLALADGAVVALKGELGAGKTVIVKGIATALGITEAIISPSFTLIQEYEGDLVLRHLDLYRLSGADELESIGGEELLYQSGVTVIEWAEKISDLLPPATITISLEIASDLSRNIVVEGLTL